MRHNRPHPGLPFITLHLDRPTPEERAAYDRAQAESPDEYLGGCDVAGSASIDGDDLFGSYLLRENDDDETLFSELAHYAEVAFFREQGAFHLLRAKAHAAARDGDLATLATLAEGYGYWRGVTEANARAADLIARADPLAAHHHASAGSLSFCAKKSAFRSIIREA